MKKLLLIALALTLMGQECELPEPDPGYCSGAEGVVNYTVGGFSTIIGGELSTDRRAAVQVWFGRSYCSGTVVGKRTVLVAAHCGYGATTTHRIEIDKVPIANAPTHFYHPDYQAWIDRADPPSLEAWAGRRADLMYLYTDTDLPKPWINKWYSTDLSPSCVELIAQGYGKDEFPEEGSVLRESRYRVKRISTDGKHLVTEQATWGGSCFGDSGSCLYAPVGDDPAVLYCAGVLSTTATKDCLVSASYVNTDHYRQWLDENLEPPT